MRIKIWIHDANGEQFLFFLSQDSSIALQITIHGQNDFILDGYNEN